ncbi:MAG: TraR/DksA C4-type zinc finger protein [Candidatus Omnitrophica bacterium]|nr:TraR/DksA C4-type zinc finger protein [Candidatus Omnitrophota bacterium]
MATKTKKKNCVKIAKKACAKIVKKKCAKAVKKMPRKEMAKFKEHLLAQKDKVQREIKSIRDENLNRSQKDASGDLSGYAFHLADMATDNYDREFSLGLADNELKILYSIDDALERIKEGTFGICENCEKPIAKRRLMALTHTKFCLSCMSEEEKANKR